MVMIGNKSFMVTLIIREHPSKQSDVGKTLSQRYTLRSHNVILLRRHNVLLWTPQHVNTTIHTTSSQRNITTLS